MNLDMNLDYEKFLNSAINTNGNIGVIEIERSFCDSYHISKFVEHLRSENLSPCPLFLSYNNLEKNIYNFELIKNYSGINKPIYLITIEQMEDYYFYKDITSTILSTFTSLKNGNIYFILSPRQIDVFYKCKCFPLGGLSLYPKFDFRNNDDIYHIFNGEDGYLKTVEKETDKNLSDFYEFVDVSDFSIKLKRMISFIKTFIMDLKNMIIKKKYYYEPDFSSPPGETIKQMLYEKDMNVNELCEKLNMRNDIVTGILDGVVKINKDRAEQLGNVLGPNKRFWLNREKNYRNKFFSSWK